MNRDARRKIEMGKRVLEWSVLHPDSGPGSAAALKRLQDRLARADQLAEQQRDGLLEVRRSSARKRELRREIKLAHLNHIVSVAKVASVDEPDLVEKFKLPGRATNYSAFRTAARGILSEAESRKELLVNHGLSEPLLDSLRKLLDELDSVVDQGAQGRALHVGASVEQDNVADEIVQSVKIIDGSNRFRFARDGELLSAWETTSNLAATPRRATKPVTGGGSASGSGTSAA
jgi:hypothetical protein